MSPIIKDDCKEVLIKCTYIVIYQKLTPIYGQRKAPHSQKFLQ